MNRLGLVGALIIGMSVLTASSGDVLALEGAGGDVSAPASDWLIETIDATREVGYNVSVAVDPETGHTYISYYEGINGDLWLARTGAPSGNCGPGNTWECQVLDSNGVVGKYSSIAVGGPGPFAKLYISYHDVTNGALNVVMGDVDRSTGELTYGIVVVESGSPASGYFAGTTTAAVIADSGSVHIAYQVKTIVGSSEVVKYAKKHIPSFGNCGPGDGWLCTTIQLDTDIGDYIDIDVGADGYPMIAFYDASGLHTAPILAWRTTSGGTCNNTDLWNCEALSHSYFDTGQYVSLAVDHDGFVQLAYRNSSADSVSFASLVGSFNGNCGIWDRWQCESIDYIGPGGSPSGIDIVVDALSRPTIVYQDVESGYEDLKIARSVGGLPGSGGNCGPISPFGNHMWLCETLKEGSLTSSEAYGGLSIALNANDEAAVAYRRIFDPIITPERGQLMIALESSIFVDGFESGNTSRWSATVP